MRLYIGVDPGGTIGMGMVTDSASGLCSYHEFSNPVEAMQRIRDESAHHTVMVSIEDFLGAGPRGHDASMTTKQVGFFDWACELFGIEHRVVGSQVRKAQLAAAAHLLGLHEAVGVGHPLVHQQDALAHALAYRKKVESGN